jgi:carboxyl-terminal processing protease
VKIGDRVAFVVNDDGSRESVESLGYDGTLGRLKGEEGTVAKFVVLRDENGDGAYQEIEFAIERAQFEVVSVMYHVYESDCTVGVIQISGFDRSTVEQFKKAVEDLRSKGVTKLVFDVRNNPGGDKDAVCDILDYLLPEGALLRTVDANGTYTTVETSDASFLDMPMAVVVNGNTASAGELFAAAIKDYEAGKLVGDKTYGKGSMQSILSVLGDGSLLKVTTALYCPPVSENYDGVGITPDVVEPLAEELLDINFYKLTDANDNQLRAAVKTFE